MTTMEQLDRDLNRLGHWLNGGDDPHLNAQAMQRLSGKKYTLTSYMTHSDGFSITAATEIEAYRFAHDWQHAKKTIVRPAAPGHGWSVQVYTRPGDYQGEEEHQDVQF